MLQRSLTLILKFVVRVTYLLDSSLGKGFIAQVCRVFLFASQSNAIS